MRQWGLFLLSLGAFMIMLSSVDGYKFGVMITGFAAVFYGAYLVWGKKRK